MFSSKEKRILGGGYFTIIREEEKFIEVCSKCTGHCWMVFKKTYDQGKPIVLYHKHCQNDAWYHEHWKTWTVKSAVSNIKAHDDYVLRRLAEMNTGRFAVISGNKFLIIRPKFEKFLEESSEV